MSGLGFSVGRWLFRGIESGDAQTHPMASPLNALADPDAEASANVPEVTWICFTATADRYIFGVEAMVLLTHGTFATRTHRTVLVAGALSNTGAVGLVAVPARFTRAGSAASVIAAIPVRAGRRAGAYPINARLTISAGVATRAAVVWIAVQIDAAPEAINEAGVADEAALTTRAGGGPIVHGRTGIEADTTGVGICREVGLTPIGGVCVAIGEWVGTSSHPALAIRLAGRALDIGQSIAAAGPTASVATAEPRPAGWNTRPANPR